MKRIPLLSELVENNDQLVVIKDMADYAEIFYSIEYQILIYWMENPTLKDSNVLSTFYRLLKNFDNHREQYLTGRIERSVKEMLRYQRKKGQDIHVRRDHFVL